MAAVIPAAPAACPSTREFNVFGLLGAFGALALILLLPAPQGLPYAGQVMLGLLLFSVILWMTEAVDYAVSAVLITALLAFRGAAMRFASHAHDPPTCGAHRRMRRAARPAGLRRARA